MRPKAFLTDCSTLYVGSRKNALDYKPMLHEIFGRDVIAGREKPRGGIRTDPAQGSYATIKERKICREKSH